MSELLVDEGRRSLPEGSIGTSASGWWGAWFIIISDSAIFAYLFFAYFWYSVQPSTHWIPAPLPSFVYSGPQTGIVLLGCISAWYAHRAINRNEIAASVLGLAVTVALGAAFIALQFVGWKSKSFSFNSSTYSSIYYVITGMHLVHFIIGWVMFVLLLLWTLLGYFDAVRHVPITIGKLYWYWLAVVWLAVFFVVDGTPYFF
jgi:heme/copper-type cytochrome/quinol oxidase subunit 3